ncbi:MAG: helix-turn-helix domain-containing protein, partial [Pseudomonadota bacterium]|nr:helix-turn-helix domain-containing protein [Pseudomonadota bacterium]
MQEPETIQQMLALHALGWGTKRIAGELGVARNTVKRYL